MLALRGSDVLVKADVPVTAITASGEADTGCGNVRIFRRNEPSSAVHGVRKAVVASEFGGEANVSHVIDDGWAESGAKA